MGSERLHNEVILTSSSVCVAREYIGNIYASPSLSERGNLRALFINQFPKTLARRLAT